MWLASEATFGPIAGASSFKTADDVVRRYNDTEVGLAEYVFSKDIDRVWRIWRGLWKSASWKHSLNQQFLAGRR